VAGTTEAYRIPISDLWAFLETTVKEMGWTVRSSDPAGGLLVARKGTSPTSWAEPITITARPASDGSTAVTVAAGFPNRSVGIFAAKQHEEVEEAFLATLDLIVREAGRGDDALG
jgi:hypothetical protein